MPETTTRGYPVPVLADAVDDGAGHLNAFYDLAAAIDTDVGAVAAVAFNKLFFGDGSDGAVTIVANTTLTRDMYYSSLVVNAGVTLNTNGWRIFCRGDVGGAGTIANDGANGSNGGTGNGTQGQGGKAGGYGTNSPGAYYSASGYPTCVANLSGSNGGNGGGPDGVGQSQGNPMIGYGGAAGAGGAGSVGAAGPAGTTSLPAASKVDYHATSLLFGFATQQVAPMGGNTQISTLVTTLVPLLGGASGGGGGFGAAGSGAGAGGGGGGGVVFIAARSLSGTLTIRAKGGDGGNGGNANGGGGGGGGGGSAVIISLSNPAAGITYSFPGGAGGLKNGTGVNGVAGSAGTGPVLLTAA